MQLTHLNQSNLLWWLEIRTHIPSCTYYFGPFDRAEDAKLSKEGYIEDLVQEKAQGITVELKKCQPQMLTICEDELELTH